MSPHSEPPSQIPRALSPTSCSVLRFPGGRLDIKEDGFFAGPYRQERMLNFELEQYIEEAEAKEDLTVGDRTGRPQMCPWFPRGMCRQGYKCLFRHQRKPRTDVCKHWLRSQCKTGDDCDYLHQYEMKRMPLCHFFTEGQCTKDDCQFLHIRPEDKTVECPWYARGHCKHGAKCRKRHVRKSLCGAYMAGFCPRGPDCPLGHPKWEQPEEVPEGQEVTGIMASIRCHNCFEHGHKAANCPHSNSLSAQPINHGRGRGPASVPTWTSLPRLGPLTCLNLDFLCRRAWAGVGFWSLIGASNCKIVRSSGAQLTPVLRATDARRRRRRRSAAGWGIPVVHRTHHISS